MLSLLLAAISAFPEQAPTVTVAAPKQRPAAVTADPFADPEPDVVVRGRTVKLVVRGRDAASLKTLQVSPPDDITLRSVTALPARSDGSVAVSVELLVGAAAEPGERALLLTVAPAITTSSSTRSGGDSVSKAMDALLATVTRDRTEAVEAGTLYINSHAIAVSGVAISRDQPREVHVFVTDANGDLEEPAPARIPATGITQLRFSAELVVSEARCGREVFDSPLDDAMVREAKAGTAVVVAMLDTTPMQRAGTCSLRVRVRDAAGNTSPWFTTPFEPR